jgi:hypothetical protein
MNGERGDRAAIAQLQFQGGSFDDPSLIRTMAGYRGYGLSNPRRCWTRQETG